MGTARGAEAGLAAVSCLKTQFLVLLLEADSRCLDGAWRSVIRTLSHPHPQACPEPHTDRGGVLSPNPTILTCALFPGRVGISWEAVPRHNQKLFPYEENSEMAILKLTL